MEIHAYEKLWLALALVLIVGFIGTITYGAAGAGIEMIDDEGGTVDPADGTLAPSSTTPASYRRASCCELRCVFPRSSSFPARYRHAAAPAGAFVPFRVTVQTWCTALRVEPLTRWSNPRQPPRSRPGSNPVPRLSHPTRPDRRSRERGRSGRGRGIRYAGPDDESQPRPDGRRADDGRAEVAGATAPVGRRSSSRRVSSSRSSRSASGPSSVSFRRFTARTSSASSTRRTTTRC